MCKLFIATGKFTPAQVRSMLDAANAAFATTQRDGFGFVAYGGGKAIAHGRYLDPENYAGFGVKLPSFVRSEQIESGVLPKVTTALVVHGRTSTNSVRVENCHPFQRDEMYLAHNGVLTWAGTGKGPESRHGCDTDEFFAWLHGHASTAAAWDTSHEHWSGYGVFGVIDRRRSRLTVAKCGNGRLHWSGNLNAHLFSTDSGDVSRIARAAKIDVSKPISVSPKTIITYDIRNGLKMVGVDAWKGFAAAVRDTKWSRSMGEYSSSFWSKREQVRVDSKTDTGITVPRDRVATRKTELFPDWEPSESNYNGQVRSEVDGL